MEQVVGVSPMRSAASVAVIGPSIVRASIRAMRTGWASARNSRASSTARNPDSGSGVSIGMRRE